MRITSSMMTRSTLASLQLAQSRIDASQRRIASGLRIEMPSDSPGDTARLLSLRRGRRESALYRRSISDAVVRLGETNSRLDIIQDGLLRAKEIVVGAGQPLSNTARLALAADLEGVLEGILEGANARSGGLRMFGGTKLGEPFVSTLGSDPDGEVRIQAVSYQGNASAPRIEISKGRTVAVGAAGDVVFAPGAGGVFETLISIRQALAAGGAPSAADQDVLDGHLDRLSALQARLGASEQSLAAEGAHRGQQELLQTARLSKLQGADLAEEAFALTSARSAYEAALSAAGRTLGRSLIDFI